VPGGLPGGQAAEREGEPGRDDRLDVWRACREAGGQQGMPLTDLAHVGGGVALPAGERARGSPDELAPGDLGDYRADLVGYSYGGVAAMLAAARSRGVPLPARRTSRRGERSFAGDVQPRGTAAGGPVSLRLEARFSEQVARDLTRLGHERVELTEPWSGTMGHAQAIRVLPGRLEAAAGPRSDGAATGL
jgi:hypothetical protein